MTKSRFRRLVSREDAGLSILPFTTFGTFCLGVRVNDQDLKQELDEIKEELSQKRDVLRTAFIYYSMQSGPLSRRRCRLRFSEGFEVRRRFFKCR